jgi:hypothetical protein
MSTSLSDLPIPGGQMPPQQIPEQQQRSSHSVIQNSKIHKFDVNTVSSTNPTNHCVSFKA